MIRYKDKFFPEYFIDPVTAVITNSKGEIQKTSIHKNGRPYFKNMDIHKIQVHTNLGYKKDYDIHHIDENKMNNSLSNLVYLTRSEHSKIHHKSENHPLYGKHHSDEAKKKMSEALKGRIFSEDYKRKMSELCSGEKNGMYGKHHSEESKKKMSEAAKGKTLSEETKRKIGEASKGKNKDRIWINNGILNKFVKIDEDIPEGFVKGMLKRKK